LACRPLSNAPLKPGMCILHRAQRLWKLWSRLRCRMPWCVSQCPHSSKEGSPPPAPPPPTGPPPPAPRSVQPAAVPAIRGAVAMNRVGMVTGLPSDRSNGSWGSVDLAPGRRPLVGCRCPDRRLHRGTCSGPQASKGAVVKGKSRRRANTKARYEPLLNAPPPLHTQRFFMHSPANLGAPSPESSVASSARLRSAGCPPPLGVFGRQRMGNGTVQDTGGRGSRAGRDAPSTLPPPTPTPPSSQPPARALPAA
jgi:hypothetical protein